MAVSWSWEFTTQLWYPDGTDSGQYWVWTVPIFAPKTLQRVILRLGETCNFGFAGDGPPPGVPAATFGLDFSVGYPGSNRQLVFTNWAEALHTDTVIQSDGSYVMTGCGWFPFEREWDITVRKTAPPPPADEMDITIGIGFNPGAPAWVADHVQPTNRVIYGSLQYLTSEPST